MTDSAPRYEWDEVRERLEEMDLEPEVYYHSSEQMDEIGDGEADLVVTSPPYPFIKKWDDLLEEWLQVNPGIAPEQGVIEERPKIAYEAIHGRLAGVWQECERILRDGGILAVNIGDATRTIDGDFARYPNHVAVTRHCESMNLTPLIDIHWKKPANSPNSYLGSGMLPTNAYVTMDTEYILIFRKGGTRDFEPNDPLRYASAYTKEQRDKWFSQTWRVNGKSGAGEFSAFPEVIPERLIRMYSILGDTVVDPFLGTGTTVRVARKLGRKGIGYEREREALEDQITESRHQEIEWDSIRTTPDR